MIKQGPRERSFPAGNVSCIGAPTNTGSAGQLPLLSRRFAGQQSVATNFRWALISILIGIFASACTRDPQSNQEYFIKELELTESSYRPNWTGLSVQEIEITCLDISTSEPGATLIVDAMAATAGFDLRMDAKRKCPKLFVAWFGQSASNPDFCEGRCPGGIRQSDNNRPNYPGEAGNLRVVLTDYLGSSENVFLVYLARRPSDPLSYAVLKKNEPSKVIAFICYVPKDWQPFGGPHALYDCIDNMARIRKRGHTQ